MSNRIRGDYFRAPLTFAASGIVIPVHAGKLIRVNALFLMSSGTVNVQFQTGAASPSAYVSGLMYLVANAGLVLPLNDMGWFDTNRGDPLYMDLSASVAVGGVIGYTLV